MFSRKNYEKFIISNNTKRILQKYQEHRFSFSFILFDYEIEMEQKQ